ncbi:MAG: D-alanyl-D-alanine carboxypeptidase family protein, partial [Candidatus Hydrogenedentes bacterium]|nr:D-alanyl-D-alanine carboxypeptidase family protein [Candidatus Hydrogenedentota bacterium]
MRRRLVATIVFALAVLPWLAACLPRSATPPTTELVELDRCIPDIVLDIRYATTNNFTGKVVYPEARCFLAKDAAIALAGVQEDLKEQGYRLKVFDGYRPLSVQRVFWKILPDPRYVADPSVGSKHNRGYAVDAALLTLDGSDV